MVLLTTKQLVTIQIRESMLMDRVGAVQTFHVEKNSKKMKIWLDPDFIVLFH
jgi:hypothetical protein